MNVTRKWPKQNFSLWHGGAYNWIWRNYLIEILNITIFIQSLIIRRCKPPSKLIKVLLIEATREISKIEGICQTHQKNIFTFFQMLQKNKNSLSPSPPYSGKGFFFFLKKSIDQNHSKHKRPHPHTTWPVQNHKVLPWMVDQSILKSPFSLFPQFWNLKIWLIT